MVQLLDRAFIGTNPQGVVGYWVPDSYGFWTFMPLSVTEELDRVSKQTLFYTPAVVTGEILTYGIIISGTTYNKWNIETLVGKEFELIATAKYASGTKRQTQMQMTVWRPSGTIIEGHDSDMFPYDNPGEIQNFHISGFLGEAYNIDEPGTWLAELRYVWVV